MKFSLKARLMISYGLMTLVIVASLLLISRYMLEDHFQNYVKQKQERVNENLVEVIKKEMKENGIQDMNFLRKLGNEALNQGIILKVTDSNGNEIYCEQCSNMEGCDHMLGMMQNTMQKRYPSWQGKYTEKVYQLESDGVNYGSITLGHYGPFFFSEDDMHFINLINGLFLGAAVFMLVISFALGAILSARIAKPIKYVIDRTHAIEQNNYSERIDFVSNTKEIDQLIKSVNTLASTLDKQQQVKKQMANDYAHEFRTPLAALQSNLEGMIDGIFEPTPERLENCRAEILRLARMTTQIDRLVALENNQIILKKESFDFSVLLKQSVTVFEKEIHDKKIDLKVDAPSCMIYADRDQLNQVIVNLISNAVKYTDTDGCINVCVRKTSNNMILTVSDTGEGISPNELPNIFEYLYRADHSRVRTTGGFGIGLAVVKAIVITHKGSIEVNSILGQGSEFIVTIPLK